MLKCAGIVTAIVYVIKHKVRPHVAGSGEACSWRLVPRFVVEG